MPRPLDGFSRSDAARQLILVLPICLRAMMIDEQLALMQRTKGHMKKKKKSTRRNPDGDDGGGG